MNTFFEVKSQWRADTLMEHFETLKIDTVELIPGNVYQFLSKEKKVILALESEEIPYVIDERAFFCLGFDDEYHWNYKAQNTDTWGKIRCQEIDALLHRTCDNILIKPSMMIVDAELVKYIVLEDSNKDYVYYNLSTREYQYSFDKDIVLVYAPHDPKIKARRLIWREKEKEVTIEELVKCYAQKHNFDPKNIIVI